MTGGGGGLRLRPEDPVPSRLSRHRHHRPLPKDSSYEYLESFVDVLALVEPELDYLRLSCQFDSAVLWRMTVLSSLEMPTLSNAMLAAYAAHYSGLSFGI